MNAPIQQYIGNPTKRPVQIQQQIHDKNIQLNIAWMKMDATIYPKLFTEIDFSLVFPYVIKVMVTQRSNIDKFNSTIDVPIESPAAAATAAAIETSPNRKRTPKRNESVKPPLEAPKMTNGLTHKPIQLKECCVRLPQLQFDENGQVIQQQHLPQIVRNHKRKYSLISNDQKLHSEKITPIRNGGGSGGGAICADDTHEFKFKCSSSSTPFIRNGNITPQNDGINGDSGSIKQKRRIPAHRLTISTPVSSQERKTGSTQFNPRIRLLKMPDNVSKLNISIKTKTKRKNRDADKKSTKLNGKIKNASSKRIIKKKIRPIPNESQLFETPIQNRKEKKVMAKDANAATTSTDVAAASVVAAASSPPAITTPTTPEIVNNDSEVMDVTPCRNTIKMEDL